MTIAIPPPIPLDDLAGAQQTALVHLLLYVTGETHRQIQGVVDAVTRKAVALADADGRLLDGALFSLEDVADAAWASAWRGLTTLWEHGRRHAAALPYGVLAAQHDAIIGGAGAALAEALGPELRAYGTDLDDLLAVAAERANPDGLSLSKRLWRLDRAAREGISATLLTSIAEGQSAYETAQAVEQYLGAGAECPRWTTARLRLTKAQIAAGDSTGLRSGSPCDSVGVAYAALRLARTEIQAVHHIATARAYGRMPWLAGVAIRLSSSHPKPDVCDLHAKGGPLAGGAYPVGEQPIPPYHPHCLCYQEPILRPLDEVQAEARAYVEGAESPAWESYAGWLGRDRASLAGALIPLLASALIGWLTDDPDDMEERISGDPAAA